MIRAMSRLSEPQRIRRWLRGQRAAEERQRNLWAAEGPKPAQAVAESLSTLNALHAMGMWPGPLDPISVEGVQRVRRRWARVQRRARYEAALKRIDAALTEAIFNAVTQFQTDMEGLARAVLVAAQGRHVKGRP
jgi:hypothetical protein